MERDRNIAQDLFQLYLLYNRKSLLKIESSLTGFNQSHYDVLLLLDGLTELPMSSVAKELTYSKAYITALADFLHSKGLLKRIPSTEDRRVILLSLSERGKLFVKNHRESVESAIKNRIAYLNPKEAEILAGLASETVRILSLLPDSEVSRYYETSLERRKLMYQPTTKYFPVLIENLEMIPTMFAEQVQGLLKNGELPYCINIPEYESNNIKYPGWLIIMNEQTLTILKDSEEERSIMHFPIQEVCYLERGCILLNSWIEISAMYSGHPVTARIEFNTTREDLMQPIIDRIRKAYCTADTGTEKIKSELAFLKTADLKFYNFSHSILLPGSDFNQVIYQPEIKQPVIKLSKVDNIDTHLTLIGQNELLDITESGHIDAAGTRNIGAIWRFIPKKAIRKVIMVENKYPKTAEYVIQLDTDQKVSLFYDPKFKDQLASLLQ